MSSAVHDHRIRIVPDDIDFMGHVKNARSLNWVQDAVVEYWERIAPAEAVAAHLWVALKHEITYLKPTFLDDLVVADVIAEHMQGVRAYFNTAIRRGEEVVAEVKSVWCCLDSATKRPARLAKEVVSRFVPG